MDGSTVKPSGMAFVDACNGLRSSIKIVATETKAEIERLKQSETDGKQDQPEMIANLMLCYRHLEDASMRLGKAIQAHDGGKSVYDKETTVGA